MSRVLLVDDDRPLLHALGDHLRSSGHVVRACEGPDEALAWMRTEDLDVVLLDLELPQSSGLALCERLRACRPDVPVVILTAYGNFEAAVGAMRAGASDFLSKPVPLETLSLAVDRAAAHRAANAHARTLEETLVSAGVDASDHGIVAASRAMRDVLDVVARVARSDATVLVSGESGTGKEVVARELHRTSRRSSGPFIAINCAAMTEPLLESELFGHVRGAFTDAHLAKSGLLLAASGGTLFLDEIGEMPLTLQPKLLRALQERVVRPVGGSVETPIDVRVVAATNRCLEDAVERRFFRADLYYRLDVVRVAIPSLRARPDDILPLATRFLASQVASTGKAVVGMLPATTDLLLDYPWPGNVRELKNCIERALALTRLDRLAPCDLPERISGYRSTATACEKPGHTEIVTSLDDLARDHLRRALTACAGNKSAAARTLGIDRKRLYRLLARLGVGD